MDTNTQLDKLIRTLLQERGENDGKIPQDLSQKQELFRGLCNIRPPRPVSQEFLQLQDEYLLTEREKKGIVAGNSLPTVSGFPKICLWQGDITRLQVDAIVNAANDQMLGCFIPSHRCIDNAIHSAAGVQLRLECAELMEKQGYAEPVGKAKITKAYNLPCKYILHTVGPIVGDRAVTQMERQQLADCYRSCLALAEDRKLHSIAFCCISTGEYGFPQIDAAEIAVETVVAFLSQNQGIQRVIFNVFTDRDNSIYQRLLGE